LLSTIKRLRIRHICSNGNDLCWKTGIGSRIKQRLKKGART
jgi:hypothetical protein